MENHFDFTDPLKVPQKTPGIYRGDFKNFQSKTVFSKWQGLYVKGCCVNPTRVQKQFHPYTELSIQCLQFYVFILDSHVRFQLKKWVILWLKESPKHNTFANRAILQGLCACLELHRQSYLVYQVSVDTVGQLLEEGIYYELEMRSSAGFFILLF